jgi:hypothetical protein
LVNILLHVLKKYHFWVILLEKGKMKRIRDDVNVNEENNQTNKKPKKNHLDSIYHEILNENDAKEISILTKNDGFFKDDKSTIYNNMINYTNRALRFHFPIYQTMLINGVHIKFPGRGNIDYFNYSIKLLNANYLLQNKPLKIPKFDFRQAKIIFLGIFVISKQRATNIITLNYLKWSIIPENFTKISNDDFYLIDYSCLDIKSFLDEFIPIEKEVIKDKVDKPFCFLDIEKINNQEFRERKTEMLKKDQLNKELILFNSLKIDSNKSKEDIAYLKKKKQFQTIYYFNEKNLEHIKALRKSNDFEHFSCIFWYNVLIDDAKLIIDTPYFKSYMKLVDIGKYSSQYMEKLSLEQRLNLQSALNKGLRFIKGLELSKKQGAERENVCVIMKDGSEDWMNLV